MPAWFQAPPIIEQHGRIYVVREDCCEGGSKARFLPYLIGSAKEIVYGAPFCGGAPVSLSVIGRKMGRRVTIFYAKRNEMHRRQKLARSYGANIVWVPYGYMTNVQAKAKEYCKRTGALFLPLGFDVPAAEGPFVAYMQTVRAKIGNPPQVWCATGSGMLARCLALAFPDSEIRAVAVGLASKWEHQRMPGNVLVTAAGVPFERESKAAAPFPSCPNYDRKAWAMAAEQAKPGALFWNVLG